MPSQGSAVTWAEGVIVRFVKDHTLAPAATARNGTRRALRGAKVARSRLAASQRQTGVVGARGIVIVYIGRDSSDGAGGARHAAGEDRSQAGDTWPLHGICFTVTRRLEGQETESGAITGAISVNVVIVIVISAQGRCRGSVLRGRHWHWHPGAGLGARGRARKLRVGVVIRSTAAGARGTGWLRFHV